MEFIYHHRTAGRGGEGMHISSVVRALEACGHRVTVVSPPGVDPLQTAGATPFDKGEAHARGISRAWQWISCRCPQRFFELAEIAYNAYAAVRVGWALLRQPAAAYYERYAFFLLAGTWLARRAGRPVILEVNEVAGIRRARGLHAVGLARWFERRVFRQADEIVTVSSFLAERVLERGGRTGHVHVVPNAIDRQRFSRLANRDAVRERYHLRDRHSVVGFAGWFDSWDRLDLLVDAVATLAPSDPDLRLMLVGGGPLVADLQRRIAGAGIEDRVVVTGAIPRSEIPSVIAAFDIAVLPDSNPFGSPLVLFEFMAAGKPVVAANVRPVTDVLAHGATGWIVPRGDRDALALAIGRLARDPELRQRLGTAARQRTLANHTWDAVARRVARLAGVPAEETERGVA